MSQEVYELNNGLERIKNKIIEIQSGYHGPIIVGVAGGSGSGKTTKVAQKIEEMFSGAKILSMDDYIRGKEFMESINSCNWDEPRAYDLDLLQQHLKALKQGASIQKPVHSFAEARRTGYQSFGSHNVIVLEGLFALYPGIVEELDLKIFVDIAVHGSLLRRILRDVKRTGQTEEQILEQYVTTVYPMFQLHIEPTKNSADIIIINQYIPEIEAANCESREYQLKIAFDSEPSKRTLKKLGFTEMGTFLQKDIFYSAPNWLENYGDEMMRVRCESGRYFLAYKGLQEEGVLTIRPKIEFEIKPAFGEVLKSLGYREIISFSKKRTKFLGRGIEIAMDKFMDGDYFLELRATDSDEGEKKIFQVVQELHSRYYMTFYSQSYLEIMLSRCLD